MAPPPIEERPSDDVLVNRAVIAFRNGEFKTLAAAAIAHDVKPKTVQGLNRGKPSLATTNAIFQKLSVIEEDVIQDWIIRLYSQGFPPTKGTITGMANILLAKRERQNNEKPITVGKN